MTERFKRTSPTSIHYEFTVEDPEVFVGPWRGELPLQQMWSYHNSGDFAPVYYLQTDAPMYYYSFTDAYIAADFAEGVQKRLNGATRLFSQLIEETSGRRILEISQQIMARPVPDTLAEPLKTEANSAALVLRRQYIVSPGTLAEVSVSTHPGDRFIHTTRLTRGK